jgi:hypothetical protein
MADDTTHRHGQDRTRINVHESYELRDWSHKFNVTPEQLREAVARVGDRAEQVQRYLQDGRTD